jgi:hypothetical protein
MTLKTVLLKNSHIAVVLMETKTAGARILRTKRWKERDAEYDRAKRALTPLVGFEASKPELRSMEAWDVVIGQVALNLGLR